MGTRARRIADHRLTGIVLLVAAAVEALTGAFILGLSVKVGTSLVGQDAAGDRAPRTTPLVPVETPGSGVEPPPAAASGTVLATKEILLPGSGGQVRSFTIAGDGTIWFSWASSPNGGDRIGRLRADGTITAFLIPTRSANATGITMGPDGNVWFTEQGASQIGRMSPAGGFTEFSLDSAGYPTDIVTGPDGNLWFTVPTPGGRDWIGRITPSGAISRFELSGNRQPHDIVVARDGNLWFSMGGGLGRITPQGSVTELSAPIPTLSPAGVTVARTGEVWFSTYSPEAVNMVGRASAGADPIVKQLIPLPAGAGAHGIVTGPDGNLWVAEGLLQGFARITPAGQVTQYSLGRDRSPTTVRVAPDGTVWFASTTRGGEAGGFGRFSFR